MKQTTCTTDPLASITAPPAASGRSRRRYDAIATIRTYKDKATGEEKKVRQKIGTVFESANGSLSLKLDVLPIGPGWSGFISFYPPGERGNDGEGSRANGLSSGSGTVAEKPGSGGRSVSDGQPGIGLPAGGGALRIPSNTGAGSSRPSPGPRQGYQNGAPPPPVSAGADEEEDDIPF